MPWAWDDKTARYRDTATGQFMSRARVLELVQASIGNGYPAMDQLAGYLANGTINAATWKAAMREEIKGEYILQYLLGRGGRGSMGPADWGRVGRQLRDQYQYLDQFAKEAAGLSEKQIAARAKMYVSAAREAFDKGQQVANKQAGMDQELWVLGDAEHCPDCVAYAGEGWQEIGYFPVVASGATVCLTNCACHKEYRDSKAA
jgi:hypothetical protein